MIHNQNWVIVAAGGRGERMERKINKIFLPLLRRPVICWALKTLEESPQIEKIIITVDESDLGKLKNLLKKYQFKKIVGFIRAGENRQNSTLKALEWMGENKARENDLVGVHNAVNPLVTEKEIENVFQAAQKFGGALLACPARDTVKISSAANFVRQTPVRKSVWYAQTPQVGRFKDMLRAFLKAEKDNFQGTDDTQLLERIGVKVKIVPCSPENFKITYPWDLILAKTILKRRNV